jgi:hypothetical protein
MFINSFFLFSSFFRINAIEAELKQTHNINGQMKKDVKELKQVILNKEFRVIVFFIIIIMLFFRNSKMLIFNYMIVKLNVIIYQKIMQNY